MGRRLALTRFLNLSRILEEKSVFVHNFTGQLEGSDGGEDLRHSPRQAHEEAGPCSICSAGTVAERSESMPLHIRTLGGNPSAGAFADQTDSCLHSRRGTRKEALANPAGHYDSPDTKLRGHNPPFGQTTKSGDSWGPSWLRSNWPWISQTHGASVKPPQADNRRRKRSERSAVKLAEAAASAQSPPRPDKTVVRMAAQYSLLIQGGETDCCRCSTPRCSPAPAGVRSAPRISAFAADPLVTRLGHTTMWRGKKSPATRW
jgi:hypothetical protein